MNKEMKYYFYLARCSDGTLYSGSCKDFKKREEKHNKGEGAKYTKYRRPIRIFYFEGYNTTLKEAMSREAEVKRLRRDEKSQLVQRS